MFVGRADELAAFTDVACAAARGDVAAVFVVGDPGSGKSRLLAEAAGAARAQLPNQFRVVGYEPERDVPLASSSDLLRGLVAVGLDGGRLESLVFDAGWEGASSLEPRAWVKATGFARLDACAAGGGSGWCGDAPVIHPVALGGPECRAGLGGPLLTLGEHNHADGHDGGIYHIARSLELAQSWRNRTRPVRGIGLHNARGIACRPTRLHGRARPSLLRRHPPTLARIREQLGRQTLLSLKPTAIALQRTNRLPDSEFSELYRAAGFELTRVVPTASPALDRGGKTELTITGTNPLRHCSPLFAVWLNQAANRPNSSLLLATQDERRDGN